MKKAIKLFLLFCFSTIILSGCVANDTPQKPLCRVVTQVDISCRREHMLMQRHYTNPEKMEYVLLYLRLLKPLGKPDTDPEQIHKDVYEITVHLSDGSKRLYKQKAHRYFSRESRPWELIDPAQAAGLYRLMEKLPSDPTIL
ncbi:MAG: hypothetical protein IJX37_08330 [Oscillospiraceae bacterium]|nr:hypothetical protein [Oscillospiraceae bacterium]